MDTAEIKILLKIWEYVIFEYKNAEIQLYKSFRDTWSFFINIVMIGLLKNYIMSFAVSKILL